MLSKLDPRNAQWRQRQIDRVQGAITASEKIDDSTFRESAISELEREIDGINEAFERNELDYGRKLYLIENCIYGVDIQPIATQIAKLRFFISLIVEQKIDDTRENRGVRPLPNLETKFVAANTLLDVEKPAQMTLRNPEIDSKEKALEEVRRRHFTARTPRTKDRYRNRDAELRAEISTLLQQDGFPSETTEKISAWDPYDQNRSADFFDPEWMFGITDGFDVVIGNPPYVRQEKIKDLKPTLKKRYTCYTGAADLYVYFYERGLQLLSPKGVHTFICSNSWLDVNYGAPLQKYLLDNTAGAVICHSEAEREFESADINTIVSVLHNGTPDANSHLRFLTFKTFIGDPDVENRRERTRTYTELAEAGTRENKYAGDKWGGKYLRAPDIYWTLLEKGKDKLVSIEPSVGEVVTVSWSRMGRNSEIMSNKDVIGEETTIPVLKSPREFDGIVIKSSDIKTRLHINLVDENQIVRTPLVWDDIRGERHICRFNPEMFAFTHNFHGIYLHEPEQAEQICACLNSTLTWLFVETLGRRGLGGGGVRILVEDLKRTPLLIHPNHFGLEANKELQAVFTELTSRSVGNIRTEITKNDEGIFDVSPDRRALDAVIFDALGLTQGERDGVYEAVVNLVEARLRKARSLKGK